ncbi:MAG: hemolysin family protein [Fidelibacterota bacterium]
MSTLLSFFFLALGVSFLCSLLESVLLSVSHTFVGIKQKERKPGGEFLAELKNNINRPLAAILTINTIANTVGAAGVGAQALKLYGSGYVALASGILTLCILIFSEIIPKTIGAVYWKSLAIPAAYVIRWLIFLTYPFVFLSLQMNRVIKSNSSEGRFSREEMIYMAEKGEDEGTLEEQESDIIENILKLKDIKAQEVLTPRSVVFGLNKDETVGEVIAKYSPIAFSRIPIYTTDLDHVIGFVHRYTLVNKQAEDQFDVRMEELMVPIHTVQETDSVADILTEFVKRREHIFMVVDEFGSTAGIITLEDAIETLLGVEIVDEHDSVVDMRKLAKERWHKDKKNRLN